MFARFTYLLRKYSRHNANDLMAWICGIHDIIGIIDMYKKLLGRTSNNIHTQVSCCKPRESCLENFVLYLLCCNKSSVLANAIAISDMRKDFSGQGWIKTADLITKDRESSTMRSGARGDFVHVFLIHLSSPNWKKLRLTWTDSSDSLILIKLKLL